MLYKSFNIYVYHQTRPQGRGTKQTNSVSTLCINHYNYDNSVGHILHISVHGIEISTKQ